MTRRKRNLLMLTLPGVIILALMVGVHIASRPMSTEQMLGPRPVVPRHAALDRRISSVDFRGTTMTHALQWLSDHAGSPVPYDPSLIDDTRWPERPLVFLRLRDVTVRQAAWWIIHNIREPLAIRETQTEFTIPKGLPQNPAITQTYDLTPLVTLLIDRHTPPEPGLWAYVRDWVREQMGKDPLPASNDPPPTAEMLVEHVADVIDRYMVWQMIRLDRDLGHIHQNGATLVVEGSPQLQADVYDLLAGVWRYQHQADDTSLRITPTETHAHNKLSQPVTIELVGQSIGDALLSILDQLDLQGGIYTSARTSPLPDNGEVRTDAAALLVRSIPGMPGQTVRVTQEGKVIFRDDRDTRTILSFEFHNVRWLFPNASYETDWQLHTQHTQQMISQIIEHTGQDRWGMGNGRDYMIGVIGDVLYVLADRHMQIRVHQGLQTIRQQHIHRDPVATVE